MTVLQIASYGSSGKTAICAGLGKKWADEGKKLGYIKPVNITGSGEDDPDEAFVRGVLEQGGDVVSVSPHNLSQEELWRNLSEDTDNFVNKLKEACEEAAAGRDILIIESPGSLQNDQVSILALYTIAEKLDTKVLLLISYSIDYTDPEIIQVLQKLGDRLIGVVINHVPESKLEKAKYDYEQFFKTNNTRVLGLLPESRILSGITIGELATVLDGHIINNEEKVGGIVENMMLGVMTPDSAEGYFNRKKNKAVVARSERPDMLLAALETSTKCLIVSGQKPSASVMAKAEDKGVPVMVVNKNANEIIVGIGQALQNTKFHQSKKLPELVSIINRTIDFQALNSSLNL